MGRHLLDNIAWHALNGEHRQHAVGDGRVKRYRAGFAPLAAFAEPGQPDFARMARLFAPGETAFVVGFDGEPRGAE